MEGRSADSVYAETSVGNLFLETGQGRIFCTLISPWQRTRNCVVYLSPLFEERMWCQRIAFNFARQLAASGSRAVLMFDYHGYGESDGACEEFSLAGCRDAVQHVASFLEGRGYSEVTLWGIRTGCAVALSAVSSQLPIVSSIFWAPVLDLATYINDSLRASMASQILMFKRVVAARDVILSELLQQGTCVREDYVLNHIDGYRFSADFYEELRSGAGASWSSLSHPALVVDVPGPRGAGAKPTMDPRQGPVPSPPWPGVEVRTVTDRPFWVIGPDYSQTADGIYEVTTEWLESQARAGSG